MLPTTPFAPQSLPEDMWKQRIILAGVLPLAICWFLLIAVVCALALNQETRSLACFLGAAAQCERMGHTLATEAVEFQDFQRSARAAPYFQRACDGGLANACNSLGVLYARGRGVDKDATTAASFYRRACNATHQLGCANLGYAYMHGEGVEADPEHGQRLLKRACDRGEARGCSWLAEEYSRGDVVERDQARAAVLHQQACDKAIAGSCRRLAHAYRFGLGVDVDAARADALQSRACAIHEPFCTDRP